jgi:hypothetical protein
MQVEPVERVQGRPRSFPIENRDLLSECEKFKFTVASTAQESMDGSQD